MKVALNSKGMTQVLLDNLSRSPTRLPTKIRLNSVDTWPRVVSNSMELAIAVNSLSPQSCGEMDIAAPTAHNGTERSTIEASELEHSAWPCILTAIHKPITGRKIRLNAEYLTIGLKTNANLTSINALLTTKTVSCAQTPKAF
ncbi:unnamed protein product [Dicrocoelium dendriticum]|nr:unnamed protein product [Dicrocoelium dendriticum]